MTITLLLPQIANAISALSISGVTIKDYDEISAAQTGQANVMYPNPEAPGWITDFTLSYPSLLEGGDAPVDISYTLNYRFLHVQIGDLSQFPKSYKDLVDKVALIIAGIISIHSPYSGRVNMKMGNISIGGRTDLAGNQYHGADIAILITEMQNP
jgi:hypothetical protein